MKPEIKTGMELLDEFDEIKFDEANQDYFLSKKWIALDDLKKLKGLIIDDINKAFEERRNTRYDIRDIINRRFNEQEGKDMFEEGS